MNFVKKWQCLVMKIAIKRTKKEKELIPGEQRSEKRKTSEEKMDQQGTVLLDLWQILKEIGEMDR